MAAKTREELDTAIAEAVAADPTFRERLLTDPRAAIAEISGIAVPDFVNVTVHEETLADVHLVLGAEAHSLTEDDLQLISGGWNPGPPSMCGSSCGPCSV